MRKFIPVLLGLSLFSCNQEPEDKLEAMSCQDQTGNYSINVTRNREMMWVGCKVRGSVYSVVGQAVYTSYQPGYNSAHCSLTYDMDDPTGGYWVFETLEQDAMAIYYDWNPRSTHHLTVVGLKCYKIGE